MCTRAHSSVLSDLGSPFSRLGEARHFSVADNSALNGEHGLRELLHDGFDGQLPAAWCTYFRKREKGNMRASVPFGVQQAIQANVRPVSNQVSSKHIMNCIQRIPESFGALQNPCGDAPRQRGPRTPFVTPQHALIGFTVDLCLWQRVLAFVFCCLSFRINVVLKSLELDVTGP